MLIQVFYKKGSHLFLYTTYTCLIFLSVCVSHSIILSVVSLMFVVCAILPLTVLLIQSYPIDE